MTDMKINPSEYKILIVDDVMSNLMLLKVLLTSEKFGILTASNGRQAIEMTQNEKPDLLLLDVMMPEVDGFTVAQRIRKNNSTKNIPIIMLTALSQLNDKVNGFNIGVDDYLVKPFEMEELQVRIRALLKRSHQIPESASTRELLTLGDITLLPETYSVKIKDKTAKLTPIEFDIFNLLFQNHGNMVSSAQLLKDIWGYSPDDDIETIRVHIRHLRAKLDKISNGKKYIETIYGGGYKLVL